MALCAKLDKLDYRTYVLMGDGEIAEGAVWEAASLAGIYKLNNLIAIVDDMQPCCDSCATERQVHEHDVIGIIFDMKDFIFH